MALLDLLDLVDVVASWRLYTGIAVTVLLGWLVFQFVANEAVAWAICVPLGLLGLFFSFRWQARADGPR